MIWPRLRHIVTCLRCGFREGTALTNSYAERCPVDGWELEHTVAAIDTPDELAQIPRRGRPVRV